MTTNDHTGAGADTEAVGTGLSAGADDWGRLDPLRPAESSHRGSVADPEHASGARKAGGPQTTGRPRTPAGLGPAGRRLWRSVVEVFDVEGHHAQILALACHQADIADRLTAEAEAEGLIVAGASGQRRHHPALTEARLASVAAARIIASLGLDKAPDTPDPNADPIRESPGTLHSRHAANVRHRRERARGGVT